MLIFKLLLNPITCCLFDKNVTEDGEKTLLRPYVSKSSSLPGQAIFRIAEVYKDVQMKFEDCVSLS